MASTNRFAVYFAFGMAWPERPRPDGARGNTAPSPPAEPARIIDVAPAPAAPVPEHQGSGNPFPKQPASPTYAPADAPSRPARLVAAPRPLGLILDTWA